MTQRALSDLKVVELAEFISGPYCTKMFADLGAEVIKVEEPGVGDVTRREGPFPDDVPHPEQSGEFLYLNTNKLGITLNTKAATGIKILKELLRQADVFVESSSRRVMEELELDYESLRKVNPNLVMTSITPFGHTGPYRDYKGYDISITAGGGLSCRLGFPDREPLQMPAYQGSYFSGAIAAAATMLALYARDIGCPAQYVDISQLRCFATIFSMGSTAFLRDQAVSKRFGRQMPFIWPYTVVRIKDGMAFIGAIEEKHWQHGLQMMGNPEWAKDPRFENIYTRFEHKDEVESLMEPWLMSHTKADLLRLGRELGFTGGWAPLQTVDDLINSEHLKERGFFVEVDHPEAGRQKYPGAPYKLSETPWKIERPAPVLGQHNVEIYCDRLGYTKQNLVDLRRTGVI